MLAYYLYNQLEEEKKGAAECDFDACKNVLRSIVPLRATSGGQLNANRL